MNCFFGVADIIESIVDPIDDVLVIDEDGQYSYEKTNEKPNIDITKVTYERKENSKQVTITLEVNDRGFIEDRDDFEHIDPNSTTFNGVVVIYDIVLETDQTFYYIEYINKSCTLNSENITATVIDDSLSVTFELEHIEETFVDISGSSMCFEIHSLINIEFFIDVAPDSLLFVANINAPEVAYVDQPIEFYGNYNDLLKITNPPYEYSWYFSDQDLVLTDQNVIHTFKETGQYTVTLTVSDSTGYKATDEHIITIEQDLKNPLVSFAKPKNALYIANHKVLDLPKKDPLILGDIDIIVDARDYESGVKKVDFSIDGSLVYSDTEAPYIFHWDAKRSLTFKEQHLIGVLVQDYADNQVYEQIPVWRFFSG
jgi:PKD repeat protein